MKCYLILICFIFSIGTGHCQTIRRSIFNTIGQTSSNGNLILTTSIGQPHLKKYEHDIIYYQSFLQPYFIKKEGDDNIRPFGFFPNPVADYLTISLENTNSLSFFIWNILGQKIRQAVLENNRIYLGDLAAGMYLIELLDDTQNETFSVKIIKL